MDQMLQGRFGFKAENIVVLKDESATRQAILTSFKHHLIEGASPGDLCVFYFAGHGSFVKNLASQEVDQLDETLVPYDAPVGARDIRDKEMAQLYRTAAQKGVTLTVILDSCHSGGMARGLWTGGKTRYAEPEPKPINDSAGDLDPVTGLKLPDPASMGVLFLFAARDDQAAAEVMTAEVRANGSAERVSHGAFTASLARVLQTEVAGQSLEQICQRVQAVLASEGKTQVPVCAGKDRTSRGLLGQAAGTAASNTLVVEHVDSGGSIRLRGGKALGFTPGCTLARVAGQPAQIRLTRVDLATSNGECISSSLTGAIQEGELFKLVAFPRVIA